MDLTPVLLVVVAVASGGLLLWWLLRDRSQSSRDVGTGSRLAEDPDAEDEDSTLVSVDADPSGSGRFAAPAPGVTVLPDGDVEAFDGGEPQIDDDDPTSPHAKLRIAATGCTDPGRKRQGNEDAILVESGEVYAVADGMGGHARGDLASRIAVETLRRAFEARSISGERLTSVPWRGDELVRAIRMANMEVTKAASEDVGHKGMGTTVVAARFSPYKKRAYIASVGDSRCYRLRDNELTRITRDHTLAALGVTGPSARTLIRAVGLKPTVDVDLIVDAPETGDIYLMCSDGLTTMLSDEEIRDIVVAKRTSDEAVQALVDETNRRGGKDNVSVVLVRVEGQEPAASQTPNGNGPDWVPRGVALSP